MSVEDVSFTSGYTERFIRSRLRLIDVDDVMILDLQQPPRRDKVEEERLERAGAPAHWPAPARRT